MVPTKPHRYEVCFREASSGPWTGEECGDPHSILVDDEAEAILALHAMRELDEEYAKPGVYGIVDYRTSTVLLVDAESGRITDRRPLREDEHVCYYFDASMGSPADATLVCSCGYHVDAATVSNDFMWDAARRHGKTHQTQMVEA